MLVVCPVILFTFFILFGSDSYQLWWEKFLYELTNRYLFAQISSDSLFRPLWREDVFSGNIWALSVGPSPLAVPIVAGRFFRLSPLGIDLAGTVTLYVVAVVSMYLYLRRALYASRESASSSSVMFATTMYWIANTEGNPEVPMGAAILPALLYLSHQIERASSNNQLSSLLASMAGLSLIFYASTLHSSVNVIPIALVMVMVYAWAVFEAKRAVLWVGVSLAVGLVLYLPFLWPIVEAARISRRYVLTDVYAHSLYTQSVLDWERVVTKATQMLSRVAAGYNEYGVFLVTIVAVLVWATLGTGWRHERAQTRRILCVVMGMSLAGYAAELFHEHINYVKQHVPLLGGWSSYRVTFFSSFGLLTAVAWMLDRSLFHPGPLPDSPRRHAALRMALVLVALLASLRIAYSAYRMRLVPASTYPQNLVLYAYLVLFGLVTLSLVALLYRRIRERAAAGFFRTEAERLGAVALMVLSASLVTSIHTYRPGVFPSEARAAIHPLPMLTYAQRYQVPNEIVTIKQLNVSDSRVLDLTRPWYDPTLGVMGEAPLLALGGLRVPSGYNALFPAWYHRFVNIGINGGRGSLEKNLDLGKTLLQVEDTGDTNFDALKLLDVQYVLALNGARLPGYVPVRSFEPAGKTLYGIAAPGGAGPAFVSRGVRCFASDAEALAYIHGGNLQDLQRHAVLVRGDAAVGSLCSERKEQEQHSLTPMEPSRIHVKRDLDRVTVEVNGAGGVLTLADTYYPGWRVFVDGVERPLLRTYTTLRGVVMEPGRHSVEFIYDPRIFHILFRISNVLLVLLLVTTFAAWRAGLSRVSSRETFSHVQS